MVDTGKHRFKALRDAVHDREVTIQLVFLVVVSATEMWRELSRCFVSCDDDLLTVASRYSVLVARCTNGTMVFNVEAFAMFAVVLFLRVVRGDHFIIADFGHLQLCDAASRGGPCQAVCLGLVSLGLRCR